MVAPGRELALHLTPQHVLSSGAVGSQVLPLAEPNFTPHHAPKLHLPSVVLCCSPADSLTGSQQLLSALQQQPAATARSLEAVIRCGDPWKGTTLTVDVAALTGAMWSLPLTELYSRRDAAAAAAGSSSGGYSSSGGKGSSSGGTELFSLLSSCLKHALKKYAGGAATPFQATPADVAGTVQSAIISLNVIGVCQSMSENAGVTKSERSGKEGAQWVWLAARALMVCSASLKVRSGLVGCLTLCLHEASLLASCRQRVRSACAPQKGVRVQQQCNIDSMVHGACVRNHAVNGKAQERVLTQPCTHTWMRSVSLHSAVRNVKGFSCVA